MPDTGFSRPTLREINERTKADLNSGIPGGDSRLRRSFLGVIARMLAGLAHGLYGYLAWIARQAIPDTADKEGLSAWARVWQVSRKLATKASGFVTFTGTDGTVIPEGTEILRSDGTSYVSTAEVAVAAGVASVPVSAALAGTGGNADASVAMKFVSPVSGVNASGVVAAGGLTGGADEEADPSLLARLLDRIQQPPHGGASTDYVRWAKEVAGVTRAWSYGGEMGPGTVTVRFMMDDTYADGIPQAGDVATIFAHIEPLRPVTAELFVAAPVAVPLDIEITGITPNTAAVKSAVEAELRDMIRRVAEPGGTVPLSKIWEAISVASGEEKHRVTSPVADVTHTTGEIATLGDVTYA